MSLYNIFSERTGAAASLAARKVKSKNIIYQNIVILIYFKHLDKARFFVWFSFNFTGILT